MSEQEKNSSVDTVKKHVAEQNSSDCESEENCPRSPSDELMAQCLTDLSILDCETVEDIQNSVTVRHLAPDLRSNNAEGESEIVGNINTVEVCSDKLKDGDFNVTANVDGVELKVNRSPTKKNRRRLKSKDSDIRTDFQNGLINNLGTDSDGSFSIQHLNEVFKVWGSGPSKAEVPCQSPGSITVASSKHVKGEDKGGKEEENVNSVGTSESVPQSCDVNQGSVKHDLKCKSNSKISQNAGCHKSAVPGKSKSTEKRRKLKIKNETKNEVESEQNAGNPIAKGIQEGLEDSEVVTCRKTKSVHTKKKSFSEKKSYVPVSGSSQDLAKGLDELYQLLTLQCSGNTIGEPQPGSSKEMLGGSQDKGNLHSSKVHEGENNVKSSTKVSQELGKSDIMTKKIAKQIEKLAEAQNKTKNKVRSKNKKENSNSSKSGQLDDSGTPTKKKTVSKDQKKKTKEFEEYWSLDAVKIAIQKGDVIEGAIRINPKRYTEAYISSPSGGQDVLINGLCDRNRALEGDLVAVVLKDPSLEKVRSPKRERDSSINDADTSELNDDVVVEEEAIEDSGIIEKNTDRTHQITGKVVAILSEQHSRKCVGYLKLMKKPTDKFALFSPRDARIPRMQIPHNKCPPDFWVSPASKENILYLGKMTKWTAGAFALGEILKVVGEAASIGAETQALLLDNDLDVTPYPEEVSRKFSSLSHTVDEEQLRKREDLRNKCIFTIDPLTAKDLDDAVSCEELENGNFEIGVHISDVTQFLEENSHLDEEVSKRATSIYLVDKVHHMLPVQLCLLCSLLPGQDKFAYSVFWEIEKDDAKIISQRIVRSIINSCVKLAYEDAQIMIENPDGELDKNDFPAVQNGFKLSDISRVVNNLQLIAEKLRSKRFEGGALCIHQTKLDMQLDPSGTPIAVHQYVNKESHRLIEEFMLLANMTTAKFIYDKFPDIAFLRCHPQPHKWPLEQLQDVMASRGIHLNVTSAGALQTSLTRYSDTDFWSQTRLMVLNSLCAKTMTRAKYFCSGDFESEEGFWHYALSVPFYTHFTSPIRRYADVMVHRLLNASLGFCPKPLWKQDHVARIAANCNKKKYSAKLAGEQSIKLYLALYLKDHQPVVEDAVVIDVKDYSFDVIVCKYGLTMRVYISKLDVDLEGPSDKTSPMKLIWRSDLENDEPTLQVIDIFTIVKIRILCESSLKMEAILIRPAVAEPSALTSEET